MRPELVLSSLSLALTAAVLVGVAAVFHKVRRAHLLLYETYNQLIGLDLFHQLETGKALAAELRFADEMPILRGWAACADTLLVVARAIRARRPRAIVECGSGASTVVLARCAQLNGTGHVYSLDHDPDYARRTREALARHGLAEWATVMHAPLEPLPLDGETWRWYAIRDKPLAPVIDLLFIDGPPAGAGAPDARYPAGPVLFPRLAPGGIVFLDDAARPGERGIVARWTARFPALKVAEHPCEKGCVSLER